MDKHWRLVVDLVGGFVGVGDECWSGWMVLLIRGTQHRNISDLVMIISSLELKPYFRFKFPPSDRLSFAGHQIFRFSWLKFCLGRNWIDYEGWDDGWRNLFSRWILVYSEDRSASTRWKVISACCFQVLQIDCKTGTMLLTRTTGIVNA